MIVQKNGCHSVRFKADIWTDGRLLFVHSQLLIAATVNNGFVDTRCDYSFSTSFVPYFYHLYFFWFFSFPFLFWFSFRRRRIKKSIKLNIVKNQSVRSYKLRFARKIIIIMRINCSCGFYYIDVDSKWQLKMIKYIEREHLGSHVCGSFFEITFFSYRIYPDNQAIPVHRRSPTLCRVVNRRRVCGGSNYRSATVLASLSKSRAVRSVRRYSLVKKHNEFSRVQKNEKDWKIIRTYSNYITI